MGGIPLPASPLPQHPRGPPAGHCIRRATVPPLGALVLLAFHLSSCLPFPRLLPPSLIISSLRQASVRFLLLLHLMRTVSLFMAGQRRFHTGTWKGALSRYFYSPAIHSPAGHRPAAGRSLGVERLRRPDPRTEA